MENIQSAQRKLAHLKLGIIFLTVSFINFLGGLNLEVSIECVNADVVFKGK